MTVVAPHVAVEMLAVEEICALDGRQLTELLCELDRARRRVEATIAATIEVAERTAAFATDGHSTVRSWCRAATRWSPSEALVRVRTAHLLRDLPACRTQFTAGEVGVAQVQALARVHANPRCAERLADSDELLTGLMAQLPFEGYQLVLQRWEALADVDGSHRAHERAHEQRHASSATIGRSWMLHAEAGSFQGAVMQHIWDHFTQAEFHADWDAVRTRWGDDASPALMPRTDAQRRVDALHAIFVRAASLPPDATPPTVCVNIVVDQATYDAHLARAAGASEVDTPDPATVVDRRCETTTGVVLDPADVVAASLVGHVRRVVMGAASVVTDLGRRRRLFSGAAREALELQQHPRCLWPGCGLPLRFLQGDHRRAWAGDGGCTSPGNGALLCPRHNRWKSGGYSIWRDPDGAWHVRRPDGSEVGR